MSRYRKIDQRIWNDEKFRSLGDSAKLVFFMLLTHPAMTMLGAMRASVAGLAEELGWAVEAFREAFQEVLAQGMAEHDRKAHMIVLPNFLRYNRPESPNVVKSWAATLDMLPECGLKTRTVIRAKVFVEGMSEGFAEALPQSFRRAIANQEQEQEHQQDYSVPSERAPLAPGAPPAAKQLNERQLAELYVSVASKLLETDAERPREEVAALWKGGKSCLWLDAGLETKKGAALIGKHAQDYGNTVLTNALVAMCRDRPAGPVAWLKRALQLRAGEASKTNKQGRLEASNAAAAEAFLAGGETANMPTIDNKQTALEASNAAAAAQFLASA